MSTWGCTVPYMTSPDNNDVLLGWGNGLRSARLAAGISRQALALGVGVSAKTIQRWEATGPTTYTTQPNPAQQRRLAELLRISVTELFPRTEDEAELVVLAGRLGSGCS